MFTATDEVEPWTQKDLISLLQKPMHCWRVLSAIMISIVGSSVAGGMVTNKRKKDIWVEITQNVNAMGSGQKRTLEQVKFRWKNLRARTTKDLAEAKNTQTGNKPFKKGEYTDVVLDIIGGENSKALHGIQGVVGDGEPTIVEES